jgi:acyl-[acyl carrier protein]--UDP-N-acetylglucosamine O-acyltransferase
MQKMHEEELLKIKKEYEQMLTNTKNIQKKKEKAHKATKNKSIVKVFNYLKELENEKNINTK